MKTQNALTPGDDKKGEDRQQTSPLPRPATMKEVLDAVSLPKLTFQGAIAELMTGKKIHNPEWKGMAFYGQLIGGTLKLHKPDNKFYDWILSIDDLVATWT